MQQPDRLGAKRILCPTVLFLESVSGGGGGRHFFGVSRG